MERLEINVNDKVQVADSLMKAISIVLEAFKKWKDEGMDKPLNVTVKRIKNKAPPTLEVNVNEEVVTKTAFG